MADHTHIEWTDATWNPITGCSIVSPGCTNCYAMKLAGTRLKHIESRAGLTVDTKAGPVWNGQVRFNEQWIHQPLRWKRPRRIFVCAHGDLFAENVPDSWIDEVFAIMALAPQHTFQVLTKRAARMREYITDPAVVRRVYELACDWVVSGAVNVVLISPHIDPTLAPTGLKIFLDAWPLRNVWLGISAEDQQRADERIPMLLATPAACRFVSAEPLLGPIDFLPYLFIYTHDDDAKLASECSDAPLYFHDPAKTAPEDIATPRLDWVIVGGESGTGARPMHPDWACSIRDQCAAAEVPFFFKQWGEFGPAFTGDLRPTGLPWSGEDQTAVARGTATAQQATRRMGKSRAGRLLDGVEHNAMPEQAA